MNKKYINKAVKTYDLGKYIKNNKTNKPKKPKETTPPTEVDILQITMLFEVKERLDIDIEKDELDSAITFNCLSVESVSFSLGNRISGFGTRAVVLAANLGAFLQDLGEHLDLNHSIELKEIDMISGKAIKSQED